MSPEQISRRRMLKRIGAGAAIAWSAPVLSSVRTPALAQYACAAFPCGAACPNEPGALFCDPDGPEGTACACVPTVEGTCACIRTNFVTVPPGACSASSQCGSGSVCVNDGCFGDFCQPLCPA
jgi:hypothetical protein